MRQPPSQRIVRADRVDPRAGHGRQVDDEAVLHDGVPGDGVPAAAHRREEVVLTTEPHRGDDVGHAAAPGDERRQALDLAVPDLAGAVVGRVVGWDQLALEVGGQAFERSLADTLGLQWMSSEISSRRPNLAGQS